MHSIIDILKSLGYTTVPAEWYDQIGIWLQWYQGRVRGFHDYRVFNGIKHVHCTKLTAGMAKVVAEAWADLLMNDKVVITLEGDAEQAFFDEVCIGNNFRHMMNRYEEFAFALGTSAVVVRLTGIQVDEEGSAVSPADGIRLDFVRADGIYPISWQNGSIHECAFATNLAFDGRSYVYLQIHCHPEQGTYRIENHLYLDSSGSLREVPLTELPGYAGVAPVFHTHSDRPLFVLNSPNIANNLNPDVPMGISIFANAVDQLKDCDNIFDSLNSEFVLGRKRIMVKPEAIRNIDGEPLFDANDLVFYILPEDSANGSTVKEIEASLRTDEHFTGMQLALNMLALKCGFGSNRWKFDSGRIVTATQVQEATSDEFRTQQKHQLILEQVLIELARIILRLGNRFMGQSLNEEIPISVDFDESAIEDKAAEFEKDCRMLELGVFGRDEFRAKWVNEDLKTAKSAITEINGEAQP
ncbi:MAG: phage portal protein [Oscillospiraceae bacterium]|nr:phage portal protein [Oscillospiraceae bacterium]